MSIVIPVGQRRWCLVCHKYVEAGEEFVPHPLHPRNGRHATCEPKSVWQTEPKPKERKTLDQFSKRRRAGGHGYSGGDGYVGMD